MTCVLWVSCVEKSWGSNGVLHKPESNSGSSEESYSHKKGYSPQRPYFLNAKEVKHERSEREAVETGKGFAPSNSRRGQGPEIQRSEGAGAV